jgi:hypothetical protein
VATVADRDPRPGREPADTSWLTLAEHGTYRPDRRLGRIEAFIAGIVVGIGLGELIAAIVMALTG